MYLYTDDCHRTGKFYLSHRDKMSVSYHGVVGFKSKMTLPSVETWGTNMSILRDPPKSIQTRKIDKVGSTSNITQMIQESGDRVDETIKVYARGVNPMVAVDYGGVQGTMGGQYYGGQSNRGTARSQAYLPYRIADHGAVRLSWRDPRELSPLSRQPRVWTSSFTRPGFTDFSKSAMCDNSNGERGVKAPEMMLKKCVKPTATYHLEVPALETYEVKNVIKNPLHVAGNSGKQTTARFNGEIGRPVKQIDESPLRPDLHVAKHAPARDAELSHFNTEKYTHEVLTSDVRANRSRNVQISSLEDILHVDTSRQTKDQFNLSYTTPMRGPDDYKYLTTEIDLDRVIPQYEAQTNKGQNIYRHQEGQIEERKYLPNRPVTSATTNHGFHRMPAFDESTARTKMLRPTIQPGGFDPTPTMPMVLHENQAVNFDNERNSLRNRAFNMQQDRYPQEARV